MTLLLANLAFAWQINVAWVGDAVVEPIVPPGEAATDFDVVPQLTFPDPLLGPNARTEIDPPHVIPANIVDTWPGFACTVTLALGSAGALAPDATPVNETANATTATDTAPAATNLRDTDMCSTSFLRLQKRARVSATPLTRR